MSPRVTLATAILLVGFAAFPSTMLALNQPTHAIVNEEGARQSNLDNTLRSQFGLPGGVRQTFLGQDVLIWLRAGGVREDDDVRFLRHFHDPLKPWASAGLEFFGKYESSIRWMQRPSPCDDATWRSGQDWTWSAARCYFRHALTEPSAGDRDRAWAYTFRALGQAMHLVVDASVPEHTRNDPHPLGGLSGSYEYWVESLHGRPGSSLETAFVARYLATPDRPDPRLVDQPTDDPVAPLPIARLIDADRYTGTDPNITLTPSIGIAEFANANFFSEDSGYRRFLAPNYPYPSVERLVPSTRSLSGGVGVRAYYKKGPDDGLAVDPVLAECALDAAFRDNGFPTPQYKCADKNVWEQTAIFMLPRAVGYAAALLDYFFRGQLEARVEIDYAVIPPAQVLRVTNRTPGESMAGEFALHYEASDGTRKRLGSWGPLTLAPDQTSEPLALPAPPPDQAEPGRYLLLFRGQLGDEPDAVSARWIGVGLYRVVLWYDTYYPWDDGEVTFLPIATAFPNEPILALSADTSHTQWAFYAGGGGESRAGSVTYVYRPLEAMPGDAATLRMIGQCSGGFGTAPVTAELVELEPPRDLSALEAYIWSTGPAIRRTLYPFSIQTSRWADAQTASVPLDGARFLGVRVLSQPVATPPPPPLPFPPLSTSFAECYAAVEVHVPPP